MERRVVGCAAHDHSEIVEEKAMFAKLTFASILSLLLIVAAFADTFAPIGDITTDNITFSVEVSKDRVPRVICKYQALQYAPTNTLVILFEPNDITSLASIYQQFQDWAKVAVDKKLDAKKLIGSISLIAGFNFGQRVQLANTDAMVAFTFISTTDTSGSVRVAVEMALQNSLAARDNSAIEATFPPVDLGSADFATLCDYLSKKKIDDVVDQQTATSNLLQPTVNQIVGTWTNFMTGISFTFNADLTCSEKTTRGGPISPTPASYSYSDSSIIITNTNSSTTTYQYALDGDTLTLTTVSGISLGFSRH